MFYSKTRNIGLLGTRAVKKIKSFAIIFYIEFNSGVPPVPPGAMNMRSSWFKDFEIWWNKTGMLKQKANLQTFTFSKKNGNSPLSFSIQPT
jgi:hypothetical protein